MQRCAVLDPKVQRFRRMADTLQKQIDDRRAPMSQNPTPKRVREHNHRLHDADNMERTQVALRVLADALDVGELPAVLSGFGSKKDIAVAVGVSQIDNGRSIEERPWSDAKPAVALREFVAASCKPEDPAEVAERQRQQELERKLDDLRFAKIPGFFPTPSELVKRMVRIARTVHQRRQADYGLGALEGLSVLDPSAGIGSLLDAVTVEGAVPHACELHYSLREVLELKGYKLDSHDFFDLEPFPVDVILMNPPFEKNAWRAHVGYALKFLAPTRSVLVSVLPGSMEQRTDDAKLQQLIHGFPTYHYRLEPVNAGMFKGIKAFRQTAVSVCLLTAYTSSQDS